MTCTTAVAIALGIDLIGAAIVLYYARKRGLI
jgi:hypothetical protein